MILRSWLIALQYFFIGMAFVALLQAAIEPLSWSGSTKDFLLLTASQIFSFALPAFITHYFMKRSVHDLLYLDFKGFLPLIAILLIIAGMFLLVPYFLFPASWVERLCYVCWEWERSIENTVQTLLKTLPWYSALSLFAILPAFCEEWFFRGTLQYFLQQHWRYFAAIVVGIIFSLFHLQLSALLARAVLGVLLGWFYWRYGLFYAVIAHFSYNALTLLFYDSLQEVSLLYGLIGGGLLFLGFLLLTIDKAKRAF